MEIIRHRINSMHELHELPNTFGAEIDIRYHKNELILEHDPFNHHEKSFVSLRSFLDSYHKIKNFVNPYVFIDYLSNILKTKDIIIADDGGHLTWTLQTFRVKYGQRLFWEKLNEQRKTEARRSSQSRSKRS